MPIATGPTLVAKGSRAGTPRCRDEMGPEFSDGGGVGGIGPIDD